MPKGKRAFPDWERSCDVVFDGRRTTDQCEELTRDTIALLKLHLELLESGKERTLYVKICSLVPRKKPE